MSQTLTGFCKLNFNIEISFSEHFLHKTRPQCRLKFIQKLKKNKTFIKNIQAIITNDVFG